MRFALVTCILAFLPATLLADDAGYVSLSANDLRASDVGRPVIVITNETGMNNTGPTPPEGMETPEKTGIAVHGVLDSFNATTVIVKAAYPGPDPSGYKWATLDRQHILTIQIRR